MPRRTWFITIALILLLILSTQGIVQAKLFQLKVSVSRERLMNFELSSKALRARFREIFQNPDDYRSEIKRNVIESAILNNQVIVNLDSSYLEDIGIAIVNSIRFMSLKPLLHLHRDRKLLLVTKYAFFMERNRRLEQAVGRYKDVIDALGKHKSEILAFALLHHGYCLASLGKFSQAALSLQKTVDDFPGSHFSQTAVLLLSLLLNREKLSKEIKNKNLSDIGKARAYYNAGLYSKACEIYTRTLGIKSDDGYRWGRCSEEIGKQKRALRIYKDLTIKRGDSKFARLANRRLLILGNFYHAGKDVVKVAQKNAIRLNDRAALKEITVAAEEQREAVVVQEIITGLQEVNFDKGDQFLTNLDTKSLLKEIGTELVQNVAVKKEIRQELELRIAEVEIDPEAASKYLNDKEQEENIEKLSEEKQELTVKIPEKTKTELKEFETDTQIKVPVIKAPRALKLAPLPSYMRVVLLDGRSFKVDSLKWEDRMIRLQSKTIATYISSSFLKNIKVRRNRRPGDKAPPPGYVEIRLQDGENLKTRSIGILSSENKIRAAGKSYKYEDIEGIISLP